MHVRLSRLLGAGLLALCLPLAAAAGDVHDLAAAKTAAAGTGKLILIDFSSPT